MRSRIFLTAAFVGAAFLLPASMATAGGPAGKPKATFVKGDVDASTDGGTTWAHVKRGSEVTPGDKSIVKTGDNSRAELTFPDGSVVRVGPGSQLKVEGAGFDGKTKEVKVEATLVAGSAWAKVAKLVDDKSKFQVKTANAVAGVRGTVFRVNVDRDEATVVKVYNGAVAVAAPLIATDAASSNPDGSGIDKSGRKPIPPPFSPVSVKEFEQIIGKMMQVRIAKGQSIESAKPEAFTADDDSKGEPEWVRWNSDMDAGKSTEKSD